MQAGGDGGRVVEEVDHAPLGGPGDDRLQDQAADAAAVRFVGHGVLRAGGLSAVPTRHLTTGDPSLFPALRHFSPAHTLPLPLTWMPARPGGDACCVRGRAVGFRRAESLGWPNGVSLKRNSILTAGPCSRNATWSRKIQPESARVEILLVRGAVAAHGALRGVPAAWGASETLRLRPGESLFPAGRFCLPDLKSSQMVGWHRRLVNAPAMLAPPC